MPKPIEQAPFAHGCGEASDKKPERVDVEAEFVCGCEVCNQTSVPCTATAGSMAEEIVRLRAEIDELRRVSAGTDGLAQSAISDRDRRIDAQAERIAELVSDGAAWQEQARQVEAQNDDLRRQLDEARAKIGRNV